MTLLEVEDVRAGYGEFEALHGVSIRVAEGETLAVIGANGAGKSTLLKVIAGALRARSGHIAFDGDRLDEGRAHERVGEGIVLVPEGRRIFPGMTVMENLEMGAYARRAKRADLQPDLDRVFGLFPRLAERRRQAAGTLSGGEQQMLALGRALMMSPRLLMMDEPSLGIAPMLVEEIYRTISGLGEQGQTILLAEQNVGECLEVSDRTYVLQTGSIVRSGPSSELRQSEDVREAFLGI